MYRYNNGKLNLFASGAPYMTIKTMSQSDYSKYNAEDGEIVYFYDNNAVMCGDNQIEQKIQNPKLVNLTCPHCGAPIKPIGNKVKCEYCDSEYLLVDK